MRPFKPRGLSEKLESGRQEEIFVATLMVHLGKLLGGPTAIQWLTKLHNSEMQGAPARDVEALLGTTMNALPGNLSAVGPGRYLLNQVLVVAKADQIDAHRRYAWERPLLVRWCKAGTVKKCARSWQKLPLFSQSR